MAIACGWLHVPLALGELRVPPRRLGWKIVVEPDADRQAADGQLVRVEEPSRGNAEVVHLDVDPLLVLAFVEDHFRYEIGLLSVPQWSGEPQPGYRSVPRARRFDDFLSASPNASRVDVRSVDSAVPDPISDHGEEGDLAVLIPGGDESLGDAPVHR